MMTININDKNDDMFGSIRIDNNAIVSVVELIIKSVGDGNIVTLNNNFSRGMIDSISDICQPKTNNKPKKIKSIKVKIDKEENIYIETYVSIKYGINIPSTCKTLQDIVVHQMKKIFKYKTINISIIVQGII